MGDPKPYYKKILRNFAYELVYLTDANLAKQLETEQDIKKLEDIILEKKQEIPTETFFYHAGIAVMNEFSDTFHTDANDDVNTCIGGINLFEDFIGLPTFYLKGENHNNQ